MSEKMNSRLELREACLLTMKKLEHWELQFKKEGRPELAGTFGLIWEHLRHKVAMSDQRFIEETEDANKAKKRIADLESALEEYPV